MFRLLDGGTERRIGDDTVKALVLESSVPALCRDIPNRLESVSRHDVRMTIVMDNHVHLGRPRNLLVDLNAEKPLLREPMPALVATNRRCAVFLLRRLAYLVERMQKESTRPAGRVKDAPVARDRQDIDDELHHRPRREELPEVATEEGRHERLECTPFRIKIRLGQVDVLKVGHDRTNLCRRKPYVVLEHFGGLLASLGIEVFQSLQKCRVRLFQSIFGNHLKRIRIAVFAIFLALIPNLAEDQLVELVKCVGRIQLAAAPQRLMRLGETMGQFVFRHLLQRKSLLPVLPDATVDAITVLRNVHRPETRNVRDSLAGLGLLVGNFVILVLDSGCCPDITRPFRHCITERLFDRLTEFGLGHLHLLAFDDDDRRLVL